MVVGHWTKGETAIGLLLALVAVAVAMNMAELRRYLQIRGM